MLIHHNRTVLVPLNLLLALCLLLIGCGEQERSISEPDIPVFFALGELAGGEDFSEALAISSDGTTVVGHSRSAKSNPDTEAFVWREDRGLVAMGSLPGGLHRSQAIAVSGDGSVIVGNASSGAGINEAFRWSSSTGMIRIGDLAGGEFSSGALSVSIDGSIIVGWGSSKNGFEAAKWLSADGPVPLGDIPGGGFRSSAVVISADGTLVVGTGSSENGTETARWTLDGAIEPLGDLPGGDYYSEPYAITPFGLVIVGESAAHRGTEAFRWSSAEGMRGLGDMNGGDHHSAALDVSDDGLRVVGMATSSRGEEAVLWENGVDLVAMNTLLLRQGTTAHEDWYLQRVTGVSGDGMTVVGFGLNPYGKTEAWLVRNLKRTDGSGAAIVASRTSRESPPTEDFIPALAPSPKGKAATPRAKTSITASEIASAGRVRETEAVTKMITQWAKAWSDQDAKSYLAFYADDFPIPGGQSRRAWESTRTQRLGEPEFIKITVDELKVDLIDEMNANATFLQKYESDSYTDRVEKSLRLRKRFGGWEIRASTSTSAPVPAPSPRRRRSTFSQMAGQAGELPPPEMAAPPPMNVGPFIDPAQIDVQLVTSVVLTWAQSWSNQDADMHLSLYSSDFEAPDNETTASWKQKQRQRIHQPGFVEVTVSDIDAKLTDSTTAEVSFLQSYQSDSYGNRVRRTLHLKKISGRWKIFRE